MTLPAVVPVGFHATDPEFSALQDAANALLALFSTAGVLQIPGLKLTGGALTITSDAQAAQAGRIYQGSGVPTDANGSNGDFYFRTDTPGSANQRLYVRSAGAWVGIL